MCKWESLATLANGDTVDGATFPYTGKVDYIFASPGVQVNSARIDRGNYGPASDHWSINAVIEVNWNKFIF